MLITLFSLLDAQLEKKSLYFVEFLLEAISFANKQICFVFKCSIPPSVYLWMLSSLLQSCLNESLLHKHGDEKGSFLLDVNTHLGGNVLLIAFNFNQLIQVVTLKMNRGSKQV